MSEECNSDIEIVRSQLNQARQELVEKNEKLKSANDKISRLKHLYATAHRLSIQLKQQLDAATTELEKYKSVSLDEQQSRPTGSLMVSATYMTDNEIKCNNESTDILKIESPEMQLTETWKCNDENDTDGKSIADSIREVAESISSQSDFIYDAATQLYYDGRSGYYYDAEQSLYYDPQSGAYYQYESNSQSYQFHSYIDESKFKTLYHIIFSRAQVEEKTCVTKRKCPKRNEDCEKYKVAVDAVVNELSNMTLSNLGNHALELIQGPPCIRAIVKSSDCLDVGKLYVLTCTGATIGRQADLNHAVVIPAIEVSKMHCEIQYDEEIQRYVVKDYASQAGTFVNGKRLSGAKVISEHKTLYHKDILKIGSSTELELHIHPRSNTCDGCEPGVIASTISASNPQDAGNCDTSETQIVSRADKEKERRRQLKSIKKKYGLKDMGYESNAVHKDTDQRNRAAERRLEHGSTTNEHESDELPASVHRAINSENKGHKLLAKLGWKEGDALGKSQAGITEPIMASIRLNPAAGLGSTTGCAISSDDLEQAEKKKRWIKARRRYENCVNNTNDSGADDLSVNNSNQEERLVG